MKILELIEGLAPGGAQRFVVDLCNEMSKNHEVCLFTFRNGKDYNFYLEDVSNRVNRIIYSGSNGKLSKCFQAFVVLWNIWKYKPDIVHVHNIAFIYSILPALLLRKTKFYYTVHNVADKDAGYGIGGKLRKKLLKKLIRPVTISKYCDRSFLEFYGYSSFGIIENGCREISLTKDFAAVNDEIERYKPTVNTKVFINIARLDEQKNHELLISAFNDFVDKGYDGILLIIGSTRNINHIEYLKNLVKDRSRIIFLGLKENVADYLANADFFCLSSTWEGLPITILEAGLSGCYLISTPVGGVPDVISDKSVGILSGGLTEKEYLTSLISSFQIKSDRQYIREYFLSKYTMKVCAEKYITFFQS